MKLFGATLFFVVLSFQAKSLCVSGSKANLRKGPGNKHPVTWTVNKFMPLAEVKRQGPWVQVKDVDGVTHWVFNRLVSSRVQCLVIKSTVANLRTGPGKKYPLAKLQVANRYFSFEKLDTQDGWFKIDTGGLGSAWVHESLIWRALHIQKIGF